MTKEESTQLFLDELEWHSIPYEQKRMDISALLEPQPSDQLPPPPDVITIYFEENEQ